MTDIRVSELAGVSLLYDRSAPGHYGKGGIPFKPFINPDFAQECDKAFLELFREMKKSAGLEVKKILSGGVSRSGTGKSLHHKNRAFDLDGLIFSDNSNWVANTFPQRPQLYLGIEAILRCHFGTVLSYDYNKAHEDHFHFDNGTAVGFKTHAKSHVIFVQNIVSFVYQVPVGRDGVWGPNTNAAVTIVREQLGIGGLSNIDNWTEFLRAVAKDAFEAEAGKEGDDLTPERQFCHCCGQSLPA